MIEKRRALGKGLSALIPDVPEPSSSTLEVDIDRLVPNRFQPRQPSQEGGLEELAQSIKANGVIQPIVVRKVRDGYQIIAGERRWRAAQVAGLLRVPVVVREVPEGDDEKLLEMALVENIQRENLNPMEEAAAYQRLGDQFKLKQDQIAAAVGKDRSSIANYVRLLKLPDEVRQAVASRALSMGHARAILGLDEPAAQRRVAREVASRGLSVRQTETLVKKITARQAPPQDAPPPAPETDVHTRAAEERLRLALGTRVRIVRQGRGGTIEIAFASEEELQRIYELLTD
jgi:ParB family chromosome partitioning protein